MLFDLSSQIYIGNSMIGDNPMPDEPFPTPQEDPPLFPVPDPEDPELPVHS